MDDPLTGPVANAIVADYLTLADDSMVAILPHALRIVIELGVAEAFDDATALPVAELATRTGADVTALHRLLRPLASVGFFTEEPGDTFRLTTLGARLSRTNPDSLYASLTNTESHYAWLRATATFRTGRSSFGQDHGRDFFGDKDVDPGANSAFLRRMRERTGRLYRQAAQAVDWSRSRTILDIGGADGFLLAEILRAAPHATGVLFDRPPVIAEVAAHGGMLGGMRERCLLAAGDFFDGVPAHADTHLLCSVIHDWTDEQAVDIFRNSRKALAGGGRLLVVEMLVPTDGAPHASRWSDLGMMVLTGGRERSVDEFGQLLAAAGYRIRNVLPVPGSAFSVIEAE